jgi:hypothetical protein
MAFETRQYAIFNVEELDQIDFSQVLETSSDTVRRSVDGAQTFVKWEGAPPATVQALETQGDYLTHSEMLAVLSTATWTTPMLEEM